jgi:hypothetical protein
MSKKQKKKHQLILKKKSTTITQALEMHYQTQSENYTFSLLMDHRFQMRINFQIPYIYIHKF